MIINCAPPAKLYRYDAREWLERARDFGEFLLKPASSFRDRPGDKARQDDELRRVRERDPQFLEIVDLRTGYEIEPIGPVTFESKSLTDYLLLCFSVKWDVSLFSEFGGADACLVIHKVEEFQERIHAAVEKLPPGWSGVDNAIDYQKPHPLGMWFSKSPCYSHQEEWRFAWLPLTSCPVLVPTKLTMGSISDIADVRAKNA